MNIRGGGASTGCAFLFALPFAGVGAFMFYLILSDLAGWLEMRSWPEVPAKILQTKLETSRSSDSTTYQTTAEYEYVYDDRRYKSSRVSRYGGSDNIGSFHQDTYAEISRFRNSGEPFRCYVNPKSPAESILYRSARLGLVMFYSAFAGTFGGVGFGLMIGLAVSMVGNRKSTGLMKLYPAQPWMHRPDWSRGEARNAAGLKTIVAIAIAGFIGLLCLPVLIYLPGEIRDGHYSALYALLFPAAASLVIVWAVRSILAWKRFGSASLQLQKNPVRPGERLRGFIKTGATLPDSADVNLELKCEKTIKTRSGNKTSFSTNTLWSDNFKGMVIGGIDGKTTLQIDIPIPENLSPTSQEEFSTVEWSLKAKANIPGVDLNVTFKVPVFAVNSNQ